MNSMRHNVRHAYTYMTARYSYSCNEVLQNMNCCLINQIGDYMQRLAICSASQHYFLFSILCSVFVGTGEVRPADILCSEVSSFHFGEC
jgi:hypothetical protein